MKRNLYAEFGNFAADDGAAAAAPATPSTPAADATPSTPAPSTPAAAPAADVTGQGVQSGTPAAAAVPSWLDNLKGAGLPVGKDETETIANLKRTYAERQAFEQVRHLLPHVQAYLSQAKDYNAWRQQQQGAPAAPVVPVAGKSNDPYWSKDWQPPEYNQSWLQQVVKDANGNLMPAPGAPADVVMKIQQYEQFRRDQAESLLSNPFKFMEPMEKHLETRAREIAEEIIQKHMEGNSARQNATNFIEQNAAWLFEVDPATKAIKTQAVIDPQTGQWRQTEVLTPWGERMRQYADGVRQQQAARGYFDQKEIEQVAYAQVQRDFSLWENQQLRSGAIPLTPVTAAAPKDPQQAANDAFLDKKNPAKQNTKGPPNAERPITKRNFREEMRKAFAAAGITDQTLNQ